jgi:ATP-binding cassette, subfamily F, member 3
VLVGAANTPNVLILDEPTNHLDIESREALEDALRGFPGAILLVSHDRALLDAVGTRTVAVEDHALRSYEGGWPEYVRVRDERRAGTPAGTVLGSGVDSSNGSVETHRSAPAQALAKSKEKPKPKEPSKNRLTAQQQAERSVEEAEAAMRALEDELADPAAWVTQYESAKSEARHTAARRAVEEAYTHLEALVE